MLQRAEPSSVPLWRNSANHPTLGHSTHVALPPIRPPTMEMTVSELKVHWFLPTGGDSRDILPTGPAAHRRAPSYDYLSQVATA